jgi:hypothetical protein
MSLKAVCEMLVKLTPDYDKVHMAGPSISLDRLFGLGELQGKTKNKQALQQNHNNIQFILMVGL